MPNHANPDATIYSIVLSKLPFVSDNETNEALISGFTYDAMLELEVCFKIGDNLGDEDYYSPAQKQVIASIVAAYVLYTQVLTNMQASQSSSPLATYISKAKAGSAEVEYDQLDASKSLIMNMSAKDALGFYQKDAIRKAAKLGCIFDFCDDCTMQFFEKANPVKPFIVINDCDCC